MSLREEERAALRELDRLMRRARRSLRALPTEALERLPRLYRHASSLLARLETRDADDPEVAGVRGLVLAAHALLHRDLERDPRRPLARLAAFFLLEVPRAIRAEWRLILATFAFFYGVAALAGYVVSRDLALAYSLFDPGMVDQEIAQLRATEAGEAFRGNFTFGLGESPTLSGVIMLNNMRVGVMFFGAALLPPLYLFMLAFNGIMVGVYTAVAGHWGQAGAISSILWCHGVIELQAIVLAGTAGLVLLRAWIAPGPWTRAHAMSLEARRAWRLLAPIFPLLFVSGLIEGFVSPHAPTPVRLLVAIASGVLLLAWILLPGRRARNVTAPTPPNPSHSA